MKKLRTSTFISALLMICSLTTLHAQTQEKKVLTKEEWAETPLYQGTYVGLEATGLIGKLFGSEATGTEASVEVNLKNRYFPIVEIGYTSINTTNDETNIHYKAAAPYFRIGMNYNVFYKKPYLPGHFTVGLRYGVSAFNYDVKAPDLTDPNWGHTNIPLDLKGVKGNATWAELVLGLRTEVYKGFHMGFTIRYRTRLSVKKGENSEPYYIPGFGKNKSSGFGITYNLTYKLPF